jgi:hypothetical protein
VFLGGEERCGGLSIEVVIDAFCSRIARGRDLEMLTFPPRRRRMSEYYHGTKADLKLGDLIAPGYASNYGTQKLAAFVYLSATLEAAIWGAELAQGEGRQRIYIVEPVGAFEDDPNLTDKKFPGNPTKSYRTKDALRVVGEVSEWQGHSPEQLKTMHDHLARLKEQGIEAINE